jgi:hypothetical protein
LAPHDDDDEVELVEVVVLVLPELVLAVEVELWSEDVRTQTLLLRVYP